MSIDRLSCTEHYSCEFLLFIFIPHVEIKPPSLRKMYDLSSNQLENITTLSFLFR